MQVSYSYVGLVILRACLALLPLSYVHPDEFFQATELPAAHTLGLKTSIPWEFGIYASDLNDRLPSPPVRSMFFPYERSVVVAVAFILCALVWCDVFGSCLDLKSFVRARALCVVCVCVCVHA